ncbi:DUF6881 domain-containing protein [Sphingobium sp. YR768]|uniref:DUF6881 domain-containing protein n=1 Tax=Sphingobium sp. YR768 TaxID=1884365 RepID=UPI000B849D7D|nr:hypothetical protein [Sphingobium sp. YR768]
MTEYTYLRVRWLHSLPDEPIDLWSELNADREETRKIEIWRDGRVGYASYESEVGGTRLGEGPLPAVAEIALDPEFQPQEISADDFNRCWQNSVR